MKILLAGDSHGDAAYINAAVDICVEHHIDRLFVLGDFGIWPGQGGQHFLNTINDYAHDKSVTIYFLPGNHEDYTQLAGFEEDCLISDDGFFIVRSNIAYSGKINRWEWDGVSFASAGGAVSIDREYRQEYISWWADEQLSLKDAWTISESGPVDVLLTHDAPTTMPMREGFINDDHASESHRELMTMVGSELAPRFWAHGHYHRNVEYKFGDCDVLSLSCNPAGAAEWGGDFRNAAVIDFSDGEISYTVLSLPPHHVYHQ